MVSAVVVVLISAAILSLRGVPDVGELCHRARLFPIDLLQKVRVNRSAIMPHPIGIEFQSLGKQGFVACHDVGEISQGLWCVPIRSDVDVNACTNSGVGNRSGFPQPPYQFLQDFNVLVVQNRRYQFALFAVRSGNRVRFMMQDVTNEAVHRILSENRRGLILMYDELAGWVKNFNRYNNGSESEFWMSVFNHKVAMSDRKGSQSGVFIRNPFLCVIGTIQPKVLTDLAAGNRNANGFMERILYVFPSDQTKPKWNRSRRMPSFDIAAEWRGILARLIGIVPAVDADGEIISQDVPFSSDALDRLYQWQNEQTDRCNADGSDTLTSIASKLEIYAIRFSLLLALADWACGSEKKLIDADTVDKAIRLTEYFRATASKVQGIISEDALTELQLAVLSELPDSFTTAEGVAIAGKCGMSERSFKRFLRDRKGVLFGRSSHGNYTKL